MLNTGDLISSREILHYFTYASDDDTEHSQIQRALITCNIALVSINNLLTEVRGFEKPLKPIIIIRGLKNPTRQIIKQLTYHLLEARLYLINNVIDRVRQQAEAILKT